MRKLELLPFEPEPESKGTKKTGYKRPKSILEAFERIVDEAHESSLSAEFMNASRQDVNFAVRKLGLTSMQTILLSIFVDRSEDNSIRMSEIAAFLKVRTTKILQLADDIDVLVNKGYLKKSKRNDNLSFRVPPQVLESLRQGKPYVQVKDEVVDLNDFYDRFKRLAREKDRNELSYADLCARTQECLDDIKDTIFVRKLNSLLWGKDDKMLFIFMSHLFVENDDDNIRFGDIEDLYDDDEIPTMTKRELRNHEHMLFETKLIENVNEDGMAKTDAFKLTDFAKTEVLGELNLSVVGRSDNGLIKHDSFAKKSLVYNSEEEKQVAELTSLLDGERFKDVQGRLKDSGMRQGFCCLFYGSPGTGKTETVNQLALATGRDIMRVDVDKIKSCWVGESEKNIKSLFDRYRNICKNCKANGEPIPILLFNEADAVLGVRMEGASRAVDKMENSIQNIILQEMEVLDGIMIATTNLTTNLDKAFERRFLYKIKFEKPSVEARAEIWKTMLPGLKKAEASHLAERFDLSGGEIENVVRRHTVNFILQGNPGVDMKFLEDACKLERLTKAGHARIGF